MRLTIENLSKRYPNGVQALKGVDLSIGTGMFGLLGQNGAGKSSLMRTIATLQDPDSGAIRFGDIDVLRQPTEMRRRLGYLPQEFGIYPTLTAEEMLGQLANLKGIPASRAREAVAYLLDKVNLYDVRKKRLGGYSGGMKQRFGIAQALLGDPRIVIVDEPTAGLDPLERNRFYNLLSEIGEEVVVILSTHIVEDVSALCNDMAIIGGGTLLLRGTPAEVEAQLSGRVWEREIEKAQLADVQQRLRVISHYLRSGRLFVTVLSDGTPGEGFVPRRATLEDVYFSTLTSQPVV